MSNFAAGAALALAGTRRSTGDERRVFEDGGYEAEEAELGREKDGACAVE